MFRLGDHRVASRPHTTGVRSRPRGEQLLPDHRYALLRIGTVEFAYTTWDRYLRAMGQAWAAGFVPDPLPSRMGRDISCRPASLGGIDVDPRALAAE
jgi:hypothetical protein